MRRSHQSLATLVPSATARLKDPVRILVILLFAWVAGLAVARGGDPIPPPLVQALKAADIPASGVAVFVQEAGARKPKVSVNASQPMNPASVMKLVTTYAALELLGPAYTWRTEAFAVGRLTDGVLDGDLLLKGSGDPRLSFEQFWLLLRSLRARGLQHIRGDLVLDRGRFAPAPHDPAAFDGEPLAAYNVGADALLLSFKAVQLTLIPDAGATAVAVLPEPQPAQIDVLNLLKLSNGPCGDWKDSVRADLARHGETARLVLTGTFPATCGEKTLSVGVLSHPEFVLGVFRRLWSELGGTLGGGVRDGVVPTGERPLASIDSPPLAEVVRDINKLSNNVMARQLFLTLGAEHGQTPAREADADAAIRAWLKRKGLDFPELVLENGSGLSRRERISAESLGRLLQAAYRSPVMPEFIASLPLTAVDGTMRKRMHGNGIAGRAHVKTGTLEGAKSIAGYVLDKDGRRWVVVFLVNHPHASAARAAQDALLQWIYDRE